MNEEMNCKLGFLTCVSALFSKVNIGDKFRMAPLHIASEHGHVACVSVLLDHGAEIGVQAVGGASPLHQAAASGRVEVVRLLLRRGADPCCSREDGTR